MPRNRPPRIPPQVGSALPLPIDAILNRRKRGRPPKSILDKDIRLPQGLEVMRRGLSTYTPELAEKLIQAYYEQGCDLAIACRETGVRFRSAQAWKTTYPPFQEALEEVDELVREMAHGQFMRKVLDPNEKMPTWKIFFLKNHDPRYAEKKAPLQFIFELTDKAIRPTIIEAEVVTPLALENKLDEEIRVDRPLEAPSDTGEVSKGSERDEDQRIENDRLRWSPGLGEDVDSMPHGDRISTDIPGDQDSTRETSLDRPEGHNTTYVL